MGLFRKRRDEVIDLSALERPPLVWGFPAPCPACGAPGYLDRIDLVREVMDQHCPTCLHRWETSRAEIESTPPG